MAKSYYAKKKLVWEFLEKSLKRKIEIQWADIIGIRATTEENEPGILELEVNIYFFFSFFLIRICIDGELCFFVAVKAASYISPRD